MTISDIATQAATMVGKTDAATVSFAQTWAFYWHKHLWDQFELRETQSFVYTTVVANATEIVCPPHLERIMAVRIDTGTLLEFQDPGSYMKIAPQMFESTGSPTNWTELPPMATQQRCGGETLKFTAGNAADYGVVVVVRGEYAGNQIQENITLAASPATTANSYDIAFSISKPLTIGTVAVVTGTTATAMVTLQPYERNRRYCRVMVLGIPTVSSTNVLLLGKRQAPDIIHVNDSVQLRTAERALLTFVEASLWERERQAAKAALKYQEGEAHMNMVVDRETNQSASRLRIIPDAPQQARWSSDLIISKY